MVNMHQELKALFFVYKEFSPYKERKGSGLISTKKRFFIRLK